MANEVIDRYGVEIAGSTDSYNRSIDAAIAKTRAFQTQQKKLTEDLDKNRQQQEKTAASLEKAVSRYGENSDQAKKLSARLKELQSREQGLGSQLSSVNRALTRQSESLSETSSAAKEAGQELSSQLSGVSDNLSGMSRLMTGLLTAQAGKSFLEATIGSLAQFEQYETSFAVMLGDLDRAKAMIEDLQDFAARTPFEMEEIVPDAQLLLNYGVAAEDLIETMTRLGDLSQGQAEKLDRISLAYGQMLAKGKVTNEELLQLTEAGAPVMQELADNLQVSTAELQDMVSGGVVGIGELNAAIESLTTGSGKFAGMMEAQSRTLAGQWASLKDEIGQTARAIGEESFDTLKNSLSEVSDELNRMRESGELSQMAQRWGAVFGKLTELAMGTVTAMVKNKEAVGALAAAYGALKIIQQVSAMMTAYRTAVQAGTTAQAAFNAVAAANPYALLAGGLAAVVGLIVTFTTATEEANREIEEQSERLKEAKKELEAYQSMDFKSVSGSLAEAVYLKDSVIPQIKELESVTDKTAGQTALLKEYISQVNEALGEEAIQFDELSGRVRYNNEQLEANIDALVRRAEAEAVFEKVKELQEKRVEATAQEIEYQNRLNQALAEREELERQFEEAKESGALNDMSMAETQATFQSRWNQLNYEVEEYNRLLKENSDLISGYDEQIKQWGDAYGEAFSQIEEGVPVLTQAAQTAAEYLGVVQETQKNREILAQAEEEYAESGRISAETLSELAENYEELAPYVDDYLLGLTDGQELLAQFPAIYARDEQAHQEYLRAKALLSESYYQAEVLASAEICDHFRENYGIDLKNFRSLAEAKAEIETQLISALSAGWDEYYKNVGGSASKTVEAMEAQLRQLAPHAAIDPVVKEQVENLRRMISALSPLTELENLSFGVDFQNASGLLELPGSSGASSVKKQAADAARSWQEEYYDELCYLRDTDQISEQEYLDGLTRIRDSYRESDLDAYRKYDREIYRLRQELAEDLQKQQEEVEKAVQESFDRQLEIARDYLNERKQQISDEYDAAVQAANGRYDAMAEAARTEYEAEKERVDGIIAQIDREIKARQNAREEEKLADELSLAQRQVQSLETRIAYARTPEEKAELEKELKRQQEELKDLTTEKEVRELEAQRQAHEDRLSQLEAEYEAESAYIEQKRQEELKALEAARDQTLKTLETTFEVFERQLYDTYGYINEETLSIGKRFADATTQTLDAGFQTVAQNAQAVIDSMLAQVRRAVADMETAVAEAGSYAGESRAVYNSSDNRSANIVNHNYNGLTAGQVDAIMSRQVERVLYGRR